MSGLADVSDIFYFSLLGGGRGVRGRQGGGSVFIKNPRKGGGGVSHEGVKGAGRVSAGNSGGWGGAKYFFSGPKCPPRLSNLFACLRKCWGVQKSMGNKVPWKTGVLIYLPVTSRPFISLQKEAVLSPCNFATAHLTACILNCYISWTSRPMKRRTLRNAPMSPFCWRVPNPPGANPLVVERATSDYWGRRRNDRNL